DDLDRAFTPRHRREWASVTDPCDWATESHRAFVEHAAVSPKDNTLGEDYCNRSIPVVDERLSMAGIRLAATLNNLFGEAAASRPAATRPN
ncbi:hypothetical protein HS125_09770, partial [bacterium]|nr:hypothetical protein [bacterium]